MKAKVCPKLADSGCPQKFLLLLGSERNRLTRRQKGFPERKEKVLEKLMTLSKKALESPPLKEKGNENHFFYRGQKIEMEIGRICDRWEIADASAEPREI